MALKKATKRDARLRFALIGPAGSGKTRTALELASRLGKRVAVIDSERGRSRAYADLFDFDVEDELPDFSPASYMKAVKECETAGYDVIVIDSGSHEWAGKGGVLGIVDNISARSGNKFTAWAVGTPAHQSFIDSLLQCKAHMIVTFRARTEWVLEEDSRGKKVPKAVGMGAVAREGTEYEVDFAGLMDLDHNMTIVKTTNYAELEGMKFTKPGKDLADLMLKWLSENTVEPSPAPAPASPTVAASAAGSASGETKNGAASPQAEEAIKDAVAQETAVSPVVVTAGNPASPDYAKKIADAANEKELQAVALEIKKAKPPISGSERDKLLALYDARLTSLRTVAPERAA